MKDLWLTIGPLSEVLRKSRLLAQYGETVAASRALRDGSTLQNAIHNLVATARLLEAQPFLLGQSLEIIPEERKLEEVPGGHEFVELGQKVAKNMCVLVEWFRSRLPGYPALELPHIDPNSSLGSYESLLFTGRFPWFPYFRNLNLQRHDQPPGLGGGLEIPEDIAEDLHKSVRAVAEALRQTGIWKTFASIGEHLTKDDIEELSQACEAFRVRTDENKLTQQAGNKLYRRMQFRNAALAGIESEVSSAVRKYYKAFSDVERLVQVTIYILSTLVVYGPLNRINEGEYEELVSYRSETATSMNFVAIKTSCLKVPFHRSLYITRIGTVVYLADEIPGISGAVLVEGCSKGTEHFELSGELLRDSAGVFEVAPNGR